MDISPVAFQPASSGGASGTGAVAGSVGESAQNSGQAAPVVPAATPQHTDVSKSAAGIPALSAEQLARAISQVNDTFTQRGQNLYAAFDKDQATGISVVQIFDKNTKEVISQFPSKAIIGFAQFLDQSQGKGGQLVHVKA